MQLLVEDLSTLAQSEAHPGAGASIGKGAGAGAGAGARTGGMGIDASMAESSSRNVSR